MGVASGCGEQEVGVATGCGFKEIYSFSHTTYPYSSCIFTFLQQHPYFFVHFFKCFSFFISRDELDVPCNTLETLEYLALGIHYLGLRNLRE